MSSDDRCLGRAAGLAIALLAACALVPAAAQPLPPARGPAAREVAIGLAAPPTSFDPHYHAHVPSLGLQLHVFEPLVFRDAELHLVPALAREWHPLADGTGWEFRLDPAARFSDGASVTAADVAATFARLPNVPNSPGRVTHYAAGVTAVEAAGPQVVRLRTAGPTPLVPENLTALMIVPERIARRAATADFAAGRAAIGSGPFRLREYVAGERVVVERNDAWWRRGPAPSWARVVFRVIANDAARVAALRAGDVQLIEAVPVHDAASLAGDPAVALARAPSLRLIYLALDVARVPSPGVSDADGRRLAARNPLADRRVRRALSLAIDREAIVGRLMEGQAVAAGQLQPAGLGVADPALRPDPYDPDMARRLLAEAGWGGGFGLTLAGPNDRYVNDERILQAVAQYWERVGVRTRVEALPSAVFFSRSAAGAYSAQLTGWLTNSAEPANMVAALLLTPGRAPGWGVANRSGYSSAELEAIYARVTAEPLRDQRLRDWHALVRIAMADAPVLPLHHQVNIWATRRGLIYTPRPDEFTLATELRPAP